MLESTALDSVLRGVSYLYWAAAFVALIAVLWKAKPWWAKAIGAAVGIGIFGFRNRGLDSVIENGTSGFNASQTSDCSNWADTSQQMNADLSHTKETPLMRNSQRDGSLPREMGA